MKNVTNNNYLTILILIAFMPFISFSQGSTNKNQNKENREATKIAYFTNKMELTVEESQNFWPVVNEMQQELKALRSKNKDLFKRTNEKSEINDEELEKMMDTRMQMGLDQMKIKIKYHGKLKEILPIKKVAKYYEATKSYKKIKEAKRAKRIDNKN